MDLSKRPAHSQPIEYLSNCPACDTLLVRHEGEAVHFCPNSKGCPPQIKGRIEHFIQRNAMNIDSMGKETVALFYEQGLVKDIADLYKLTYEDILPLEGFKDQSTRNVLQGIETSKQISFSNVLFALGIRYVGRTVADKLANHFGDIDKLAQASFEQLIDVPEIGERIAQSVIQYFTDPDQQTLINELKDAGLQFELHTSEQITESQALESKSFVVSGVFEQFSREEIKDKIKAHGGQVLSSVSGKLDFLLAGTNMGPAKRKKAESLGVNIISEQEFLEMIASH